MIRWFSRNHVASTWSAPMLTNSHQIISPASETALQTAVLMRYGACPGLESTKDTCANQSPCLTLPTVVEISVATTTNLSSLSAAGCGIGVHSPGSGLPAVACGDGVEVGFSGAEVFVPASAQPVWLD